VFGHERVTQRPAQKSKRPGFILDRKKPFKPGFVTCMVLTPHYQDGTPGVDTSKKLERDLGRKKALQLAAELREFCAAPADLIERGWAMSREAAGTGAAGADESE
jgi:hypothetical protein